MIQVVNAYEALGFNDSATLASKNNLAEIYGKRGRWKEAEELFVQVMKHPDVLTSMNNFAFT